jgi:flagellar biosynthesis/type III secretory pathway M-ring protein FliF/YscJ
MNEWLKKLFDQTKQIWSKWSVIQRLIFIGVGLAAVAGLVLLIVFSSSPSSQPILTQPITDEALRQQIGARLDTEGIEYSVTAEGVMMVADRATALRARAILSTEGSAAQRDRCLGTLRSGSLDHHRLRAGREPSPVHHQPADNAYRSPGGRG